MFSSILQQHPHLYKRCRIWTGVGTVWYKKGTLAADDRNPAQLMYIALSRSGSKFEAVRKNLETTNYKHRISIAILMLSKYSRLR